MRQHDADETAEPQRKETTMMTIEAIRHYAQKRDAVRLAPPLAPFRTELTPAGEQMVIPGCEQDAAPSVRQMNLF